MLFNLRQAAFALNCYIAAMLGLYVSMRIGLERPFWAMTTVYVVSHPLTGAIRSKSFYRVIGSFLGATFVLAIVPKFDNAPLFLCMILALWVSFCIFVVMLDRSPRSYIFFLGIVTASVIGFLSVETPINIFYIASLRVQEICFGVVSAGFVHSVLFPHSVTNLLAKQLDQILKDCERWANHALAGDMTDIDEADRQHLTVDLTNVHFLGTHIPYDTSGLRPTRMALAAVQDQIILLMPVIAAMEDRTREIDDAGGMSSEITAYVESVRQWVIAPPADDAAEASRLIARGNVLGEKLTVENWRELLELNMIGRLRHLIEALQSTRLLVEAVSHPDEHPPAMIAALSSAHRVRSMHRDYGMAALTAFTLFSIVMMISCFWIGTSWPNGATGCLMAVMSFGLSAQGGDPIKTQTNYLIGAFIGVVLAGFYLFAVMTQIHEFELVMLTLFPVLFVTGYLTADQKYLPTVRPFIVVFNLTMAIHPAYSADFELYFNNGLAIVAGVGGSLIGIKVMRVIGADMMIRRLLQSGWRDLASTLRRPGTPDIVDWSSRMLDRIGLMAPRISAISPDQTGIRDDGIRDLRIGICMLRLRQLATRVDETVRHQITTLAQAIAGYYDELSHSPNMESSEAILTDIDKVIDSFVDLHNSIDRREGLTALVSLRRNMFPEAPGFIKQRRLA
ncbi:MAG: FUSC family protein [Zymomonas mobilis subsp. pomaceae]|uniref:FUSC family protein n=1 Tax=Zymomonas mobilis TaxID=542 RepID=UPI0039E769BF